jgi:hypothetical protein
MPMAKTISGIRLLRKAGGKGLSIVGPARSRSIPVLTVAIT